MRERCHYKTKMSWQRLWYYCVFRNKTKLSEKSTVRAPIESQAENVNTLHKKIKHWIRSWTLHICKKNTSTEVKHPHMSKKHVALWVFLRWRPPWHLSLKALVSTCFDRFYHWETLFWKNENISLCSSVSSIYEHSSSHNRRSNFKDYFDTKAQMVNNHDDCKWNW